ncbi:MAG: L-threonylcarbamoyladenylate synthase [Flavobacteriales bacterium]|jgi:L-threonylcarbamoyladenylate synthase
MTSLFHPSIKRCVNHLVRGGVIAYPTEAVWGFGCDPQNRHAVEYLLELKQRKPDKGLILVAASIEQFEFLLHDISLAQRTLLAQSWPGHNTWLVEHHKRLPSWLHGCHSSIALRVSTHPVVRTLCQSFGGPIVSSSANRQGYPAKRSAYALRAAYPSASIEYAPGRIGDASRASTIRDLSSGVVLRA